MTNSKPSSGGGSKEAEYDLIPWKQYDVIDNGVFAPKGSNPKFHTENNCMNSQCNPIHPFVQGYIMHDQQKGDEIVPKRRVMIDYIILN